MQISFSRLTDYPNGVSAAAAVKALECREDSDERE